MAEELQGLLERIQTQGVRKAESEKDRILAEAKTESAEIIRKAKDEAAELRSKAEAEAKKSEERAHATIQQAARDIVLSLKTELLERLRRLATATAGETMTPEFMGGIIKAAVENFVKQGGAAETGVELLVPRQDADKMAKALAAGLLKDLKAEPTIGVGHGFAAGLKIGFKGEDVFLDVSDEALAAMICNFVGPKLAKIIDGGAN